MVSSWWRRQFRKLFPTCRVPARRKALYLESLEDRTLLSIVPSVLGNTVTFQGTPQDSLYLQTDAAGHLQYHDGSSTSFTSVLSGGNPFNLQAQDTTLQVQVGGTLRLGTAAQAGLYTGGHALTIAGPKQSVDPFLPKANVEIADTIDTQGGALSITYFSGITVDSGVTISTRHTGSTTNYLTAPSTGNSGTLTLEVENPDPFNPVVNVNFNYPQISVAAGAQILAQADSGFNSGDVTLHANNTNYTLDGLTFPSEGAVFRSSAVTLADGSATSAAIVKGNNIDIEATSGDMPVSTLLSNLGQNSSDAWLSWGSWVNGFLNTALQVVNLLPGLNLATAPVSINVRKASTTVTIGQYAQVDGDSGVNIQSTSTADATGQAIYSRNTTLGAAFAFMWGETDAETDVNAHASIISPGGSVDIGSMANSTANGTARISQNLGDEKSTKANHIQLTVAVGVSQVTSHANIAAGATIEAGQNVDFEANGQGSNAENSSTASYKDGKFGATIAVNVSKSDIQATVAGTVIAAGSANVPTLTFNPETAVDFANSALRVPANQFSSYATGQRVNYDSGNGGAVSGLQSGTPYYVIVNPNLTNEIQLAATLADAEAGNNIAFDAYPTLSGTNGNGPLTVAVTSVDETTGRINLGYNPGFFEGEPMSYTAVPGKAIGGLHSGTYYAVVDPMYPNALQLSATPNGPALHLNLDPQLVGTTQNIPVTLNPGGQPNALQFSFAPGFQLGDRFVYQGTNISGLQAGVTYWTVPSASDPTIIQLATSYANAQAGTVLSFGPGTPTSAILTFNPAVSINTQTNTVDLGFNYAGAPGTKLTNGSSVVYEAALGTKVSGLVDGTTYYVIQDSQNPRVLRLTLLPADAQAAYNAGVQSYQDGYIQAYTDAYNAAIAAGQNAQDAAATATTTAQQTAAANGSLWTAEGIDSARDGAPASVGTFPVTVNASADTIDFGFNPGLVRHDPLVYERPASGFTGITGLTPGATYYTLIPDLTHPNVIQLADANGNVIALSGVTTTTIQLGTPYAAPVTVGTNTLTFGDDPTDPFDPGFQNGDVFYEGAGFGIPGLAAGTYYVLTTATPGVIQLAATPGGTPLALTPTSGTTNINYVTELSPVDTRPLVVVQLGSIDPTVTSGVAHTLTPASMAGVTINAAMQDTESSAAGTGVGAEPEFADKLSKPEYHAANYNAWITSVFSSKAAPSSKNSVASGSANSATMNVPGGEGKSPPVSVAGAVVVQVVQNNVHAEVLPSAVIISGADADVTASLTDKNQTSSSASISKPDTSSSSNPKAAALALAFGVYLPHVTATIDDGAHVDAFGTVNVQATTSYPFLVPMTSSDFAALVTNNPLNFVITLLTDSTLGFASQILNNAASASVTVPDGAESPVSLAGNIQVFVFANDTEATIGNAMINQMRQDYHDAVLSDIALPNSGQSVTVQAETDYDNVAEAGQFNLDLTPKDFIKNVRSGDILSLYGDVTGGKGKGFGASVYISAMDNTTIAEIKSGAQITLGSSGALDVEALQNIIAVSLVQAGVAAGDVGFAGTANWYNLTTNTRAQIDDGVTVNGGVDNLGNTLPGGSATVHAADTMDVVGVTGSAIKSNHIGVGFTVAVNNVQRTTLALIGSTATPSNPGSFTVGSLSVHAESAGIVASVSYAAASVAPATPDPAPPASEADSDPLDGESLPALFGESGGSGAGSTDQVQGSGKRGFGISGDASANIVQTDTEAYINDHGIFTVLPTGGGALTVDPNVQSAPVIHFTTKPGLHTGDAVTYTAGTAPIGQLSSGKTYYVIVVDAYDIELAATTADAAIGKAIAINPAGATGTQTLTTATGVPLTFDLSAIITTLLNFAMAHLLHTGEAVVYQTTGNPIGGLVNNGTYYAIAVDANRIELADSYADAVAGKAIGLTLSQASGTQTLSPETVSVNAAEQTIVVSVAGAYASAAPSPQDSNSTQLGVAGSLSTDDLIATTKAYIDGSSINTGELDVTADHGGFIGSLTAGAAGATGKQGTAVAGSISVDLVLPDTEAYVANASVSLQGDSNIQATDRSEIWSIAGSGALGGKGGYGAAVAVNLIGFSNKTQLIPNRPATTLAYITTSTVVISGGTLSVLATDANAAAEPRIASITGALGIGTQQSSNAAAGMVGVNIIKAETDAYIFNSLVTTEVGPTALNVAAYDDSWIIAVGGAVGVAQKVGIGAGIGYNEIGANTRAYLDKDYVSVTGAVNVHAEDKAIITSATIGVGVSTGQGGLAGAGSISINQIDNVVDAHVNDQTAVNSTQGAVAVTAADNSLIVSVAGGVAASSQSTAVGAAISYNLIGNTITAYADNGAINAAGAVTITATSSPMLVAFALGAAGSSEGFALGGSITVNSVSNDLDAHVTNDTVTAGSDVGSSRVDLQACKLEYSIVSPK